MNPVIFLASRYLKGSKKSSITIITTTISIIGVSLSVAAIFVTLSVINGFQNEIRQKIIDFHPNIVIYGEMNSKTLNEITQKIRSIDEVVAISPFILSQAILVTPTKTSPCLIKAVDPEKEIGVSNIAKALRYGNWHKKGEVVLGEELAKSLGLYIGDHLIAMIPQGDYLSGGIIPKLKKLKISGIINTGYFEYDSSVAFVDISDASDFIGNDIVANGIGVKIKDINQSERIKKRLRELIPFYFSTKTFADINKNLFAALKLEKFIMSFVLSLIILISTFAITSNLFIMTLIKKREIGIMKAIGISSKTIKDVFIATATFISSLGIVVGFVISGIIIFLLKRYKFIELPPDIYYITKVPVKIEISDIIFVIILSLGLTIISAYYPAKKASEIDPVDAIRYG